MSDPKNPIPPLVFKEEGDKDSKDRGGDASEFGEESQEKSWIRKAASVTLEITGINKIPAYVKTNVPKQIKDLKKEEEYAPAWDQKDNSQPAFVPQGDDGEEFTDFSSAIGQFKEIEKAQPPKRRGGGATPFAGGNFSTKTSSRTNFWVKFLLLCGLGLCIGIGLPMANDWRKQSRSKTARVINVIVEKIQNKETKKKILPKKKIRKKTKKSGK